MLAYRPALYDSALASLHSPHLPATKPRGAAPLCDCATPTDPTSSCVLGARPVAPTLCTPFCGCHFPRHDKMAPVEQQPHGLPPLHLHPVLANLRNRAQKEVRRRPSTRNGPMVWFPRTATGAGERCADSNRAVRTPPPTRTLALRADPSPSLACISTSCGDVDRRRPPGRTTPDTSLGLQSCASIRSVVDHERRGA